MFQGGIMASWLLLTYLCIPFLPWSMTVWTYPLVLKEGHGGWSQFSTKRNRAHRKAFMLKSPTESCWVSKGPYGDHTTLFCLFFLSFLYENIMWALSSYHILSFPYMWWIYLDGPHPLVFLLIQKIWEFNVYKYYVSLWIGFAYCLFLSWEFLLDNPVVGALIFKKIKKNES